MTKISELETIETALTHAQLDLQQLRQQVLQKNNFISLLEQKRRVIIGDLDEVDTPNYHFTREHRHYDKPSNWKVSVVQPDDALAELQLVRPDLILHEHIERDKVDAKKIKQLIADGEVEVNQFKSIVISKIEPKIKVKAKAN